MTYKTNRNRGGVKGQNRYENLAVEEIVDDEGSAVTKSNSNSPSEGSPSGLGRDVKPALNSSIKKEIPDNAYVQSVRLT